MHACSVLPSAAAAASGAAPAAGAAAALADALRVAIQHLQHRQWLLGAGEALRHVERGHERHRAVVADVVLAAERARVRERGRRDERAQRGARPQLADQPRDQLVDRRLLQVRDERLELAEVELVATPGPRGEAFVLGVALVEQRREPKALRYARPDGGDEHALSDPREKLPPRRDDDHVPFLELRVADLGRSTPARYTARLRHGSW
jgi:hypothetical protein